jgi:hypothetical protein
LSVQFDRRVGGAGLGVREGGEGGQQGGRQQMGTMGMHVGGVE